MAIAKMQKLALCILKDQQKYVLDTIQSASFAQIIQPSKNELKKILGEDIFFEGAKELEFDISELKFAIDFLKKYDTSDKQSIIQSFMGDLTEISINDFNNNIRIDYNKIIDDLKKIDLRISDIQRQQELIYDKIELLREWTYLNIIPEKLAQLKNYNYTIGSIDKNQFDEFSRNISKITKYYSIQKINPAQADEKNQKLILLYHKNDTIEPKINELFNKYCFESNESIEKLSSKPAEKIDNLKSKLDQLLSEKKELNKKIKQYVPKKKALMCIYEKLNWQEDLEKNSLKSITTQKTSTIFLWIKQKDIKNLETKISSITKYYDIKKLETDKNEEVPVELENNNFIKPFEAVTNIYGMPKYSEPDPTTWLAPFFILFFALCLTDAGYGIIIVIITYLMLKKWNFILIRLLNYAGWATILIGALTGGWFGIELANISFEPLKNVLTSIRIINPIEDPITMMLIALALGIIQIWAGIACKAYWNFKNNKAKDALLDQFPWLYLLIVLIGYALSSTGAISFLSTNTWLILLYIALGIIVITQSRSQKNIFLKPFTGAIKLYDIIGFLSDTLSYARLLALGLATAIIAFVINIIADLTKGVPYVGIVIFILILIGGHMFNLAINMLGSFIHSARLQYVEFFSKFMEGGGTRFKPFTKQNTYLKIIDKQ